MFTIIQLKYLVEKSSLRGFLKDLLITFLLITRNAQKNLVSEFLCKKCVKEMNKVNKSNVNKILSPENISVITRDRDPIPNNVRINLFLIIKLQRCEFFVTFIAEIRNFTFITTGFLLTLQT